MLFWFFSLNIISLIMPHFLLTKMMIFHIIFKQNMCYDISNTMIPWISGRNPRESRCFLREKFGKSQEVGSSNTVIMTSGGILAVMVVSGQSRENPASGYDHRIAASTFLPFSEVFSPHPARKLSPGYVIKMIICLKSTSNDMIQEAVYRQRIQKSNEQIFSSSNIIDN